MANEFQNSRPNSDKAVYRKEGRERRASLTHEERQAKSRAILQAVTTLPEYRNAHDVMCYLSKPEEVATDDLIRCALRDNKRVYVPVVNARENELEVCELPGLDIELVQNAFGVREPAPEHRRYADPERLDLVLLPGVAFDCTGGRIGFGKGYFDRFLRRLAPEVPRVALVFDIQIFPRVPQDADDARVNLIVTESRIIHCC